jgi:hypothetical protein
MAYARKSNEHELVQLRDEITREVNTDAVHLAESVFGKTADQPDVGRVSDEQLDATYRRAYERNDRPWLQGEARRDPEQFLKVAERLGVRLPSEQPPPLAPEPVPPALPPLPVVPAPVPALPPPVPAGPPTLPLPTAPPVPAQPAPPTVPPVPGF